MTTKQKFKEDIDLLSKYHIPVRDYGLILTKKKYKFETTFSDAFYVDEHAFENYIVSLEDIVKKNNGELSFECSEGGKKIVCIYGDLTIECIIDFKTTNWNIAIYRKTETNLFHYHLGTQCTPYMFLITVLYPNVFTDENFRYRLDKKDEKGYHLYCDKLEAITTFKSIIYNNIPNIGKIEFSSVAAYGKIFDKQDVQIASIKNKFETDDKVFNMCISNADLFIKIYKLLETDYDVTAIFDILNSLFLNVSYTGGLVKPVIFELIAVNFGHTMGQHPSFNQTLGEVDKGVILSYGNGFSCRIWTLSDFNEETDKFKETMYSIEIYMRNDGGRNYCIDNYNFHDLVEDYSFSNEFTFAQIVFILDFIGKHSHNDFEFALFEKKDTNAMYYRYLTFDKALFSPNGFYNLSKDNDNIILNVAAKSGKSYKTNNIENYDYVILDKNASIAKMLSEMLREKTS